MNINTATEYEIDEFEQEHYKRIGALRGSLRDHLDASLTRMQNAVTTLQRLCANDVYDLPFVEGRDGDDIAAFLNDSIRNVRAAYAVAQIVTKENS